ncbi:VOC family protein [Lacimicrobium sp. SS2-24]|uniref:VOC family protein n=1 Tax=Lacimicrobium sp. SS2-24 TaxID=2005569 RepID=UPI000B4B6A39|nr:VOC family protein [Lacimicrobium sp. SS2-24]
MKATGKINYVEFPATQLEQSKAFFSETFGWEFTDYGPDYTAFSEAGIDGGFFRSDLSAQVSTGSALIVLYTHDLEATQHKVQEYGGKISKAIFAFPGGRRFHFTDPSGNEFAVWSDILAEKLSG